jgi:hypothetical protein
MRTDFSFYMYLARKLENLLEKKTNNDHSNG